MLVLTALASPVQAEQRRFMAELNAFAHREGAAVQAGGTLFIGSSSIRLWDLAEAFPSAQVINHGFGGATVADVLASYDLLVAGRQPESIIVYVGENDLAEGRAATEVAGDVGTLLTRLRADFPKARIAYLSMKVAPVRWTMRKSIAEANRLIGTHAVERVDYIDVAAALLAIDRPDRSLFGKDGLHLNKAGYERWNRIVGRYLGALPAVASR